MRRWETLPSSPRWPAGSSDRGGTARVAAFVELTKPGITRLVVLTAAAGFYLGSRGRIDWVFFGHTLFGIALAAAGTNALNQVWERDLDARMHRTRNRPLPSGRLTLREALLFATAISVLGIAHLWWRVNAATALVVAVSLLTYIFIYTPLKRHTPAALWIGAVPGALPIWAGWTGAGAPVDGRAWVLFGILFLWQVPHFLALGWMYRDDYRRAGFAALATLDPDGARTARQSVLCSAGLVALSLLPTPLGLTGMGYAVAALALGAGLLGVGLSLSQRRTERRARRLFLASVVYLPALLFAMMLDRTAL
jgi:protoheme IX farnesyltransferase